MASLHLYNPDLTENHRDFRFQSADGVDENSPSYSSTNLEFDFDTTYNVDAGDFILTEHDSWIPELSEARTLEVYVKLNSFRTGDDGTTRWNLLNKGASNSESFSFGFGERDGTVFFGCGGFKCNKYHSSWNKLSRLRKENDNAVLINPDNYLNKYLHCVLTYDYPTAILYIDGVEQYRNFGNKNFGDNSEPLRGWYFVQW